MSAERPVGESVAHTDRETEPRRKADEAYDSDPLDRHLDEENGIEMIVPNRENRSKTQDGRALRRWAVERLFARLRWFRQNSDTLAREFPTICQAFRVECSLLLCVGGTTARTFLVSGTMCRIDRR